MFEVRVKAKVTLRPRHGERIRVRDRFRAVGRISTSASQLVNAHRGVSVVRKRFLNGLFMGIVRFMVWLWATLGFPFGHVVLSSRCLLPDHS